MRTLKDLSRISLRNDQVIELNLDNLPDPPPEMLKLPGVAAWWANMKLIRERDKQAFYRLVNNLSTLTNPG